MRLRGRWMNYHSYGFTKCYAEALKSNQKSAKQGLAYAQEQIDLIEGRARGKWIDQCLFDEIEKITGARTRKTVEQHYHRKIEKKALDWLIRNIDYPPPRQSW